MLSDQGKTCEAAFLTVYQSGGLVGYTRILAALAARSGDEKETGCLATAAILTAAAALEAILADYLYVTDRPPYREERRWIEQPKKYVKFSNGGVPIKYQLLRDTILEADYPEVSNLWAVRNAIVHSEPDHVRTRTYGARINPDGATWAYETAQTFACNLWGADMPQWLRSDLDFGE